MVDMNDQFLEPLSKLYPDCIEKRDKEWYLKKEFPEPEEAFALEYGQFIVDYLKKHPEEKDRCVGFKACLTGPFTLSAALILDDEFAKSRGVTPFIFKEPRANKRLYHVISKLEKNTVNYVVFSRTDKLHFDPDVLVLTCDTPSQAEIILRASSYATGKMYSSRLTTVIGCSWLYIYPYISGDLNYIITGLCAGMKARQVFPDGLILVSIPYDLLPTVLRSLQDMDWEPPLYAVGGREKFLKIRERIASELNQEHCPN